MLARLRRWLFPDPPGVAALRECAGILANARRLCAKTTATVAILRERAEAGNENAVNAHAHAHRELRAMRRDLEKMERRFEGLQATARACGVSVKIDVPSFTAEELRDEAERELLIEEAEAELDRELRA